MNVKNNTHATSFDGVPALLVASQISANVLQKRSEVLLVFFHMDRHLVGRTLNVAL